MKKTTRWISILMSVLLAVSCISPVFAIEDAKLYGPTVHRIDNALGAVHDRLFRFVQDRMRKSNIPTTEDYMQSPHPQFYPGTDGTVQGDGWYGGFAGASIVPTAWRRNARGQSDPNGYCIGGLHGAGGYQCRLPRIYSDQRMNLLLLSCGTDTNHNGIRDILIFASVDGVGLTRGTVSNMRKAIEQSLAQYGVVPDDILACTLSATHCHNALDTQGIFIPEILKCMTSALRRLGPRSLDAEMENTLTAQAAACARAAYTHMEEGTLSFFETTPVDGAAERQNTGVRLKNRFSCFLFQGESGEKTILANLAAHPTSYSENYGKMLYADYPYYMAEAMEDAGYHLVFTQSAQAGTRTPDLNCDPDSERAKEADAYISAHTLSKAEWKARYGVGALAFYNLGKLYGEQDFQDHIRKAYLLAHHVLDALGEAQPIAPTVRVKNRLYPLLLDNGVLALGCISGMLGEDVMCADAAESGYAIAVELGLVELGNVTVLTAPGELSPALLLGTDPDYTGDALWTGVTSWTGETWPYDTLEAIVRKASGDPDKTVLLFGITNGAIGYVFPDECVTQSILGGRFYKYEGKQFVNNMLLTTGTTSASQLMDAFIQLIEAR